MSKNARNLEKETEKFTGKLLRQLKYIQMWTIGETERSHQFQIQCFSNTFITDCYLITEIKTFVNKEEEWVFSTTKLNAKNSAIFFYQIVVRYVRK